MKAKKPKACPSGKQAYASQNEAWRAVRGMRNSGSAYRCKQCHEYHVTSGRSRR